MKNPGQIENFLIIRPDRLGDLVLSLPVAAVLKRNFPKSRISYLVSDGSSNIRSMVDFVDNWIVDKTGDEHRLSISHLRRVLKEFQIDCSLELLPSWRTSVACYLAGIPRRIGTSRRIYSIFYNERVSLHRRGSGLHQTDLDLKLLSPLGIDVKGELPRLRINNQCLNKGADLLKNLAGDYIVIHPGSGGSSPNWPLEFYRDLSQSLLKSTDKKVIITGNNDPIGQFPGCHDLNGKTDIEALAGIISRAKLFISGSTGPLHLADALGTNCMAIFINHPDLDKSRWGPLRNLNNVLTTPTRCICEDLAKCSCLAEISVETAFIKAMEILTSSSKKTLAAL